MQHKLKLRIFQVFFSLIWKKALLRNDSDDENVQTVAFRDGILG